MTEITIYHNPSCGTSRNVLGLNMRPRGLLREKGTPYGELGLADAHWSDAQLIDHMLAHPILINRPIVITPLGTKLCRPSETVRDILPVA
jgi:arsenate reductase (glutaredoxin)